jgi:hypothetical protein
VATIISYGLAIVGTALTAGRVAFFFAGADTFFAALLAAANRFFTPARIFASPSALIFRFFG